MDFPLAIDINRKNLAKIMARLFVMAGLVCGAILKTLPRRVHLAILSELRPAESALRRLIAIEAIGMVVGPTSARTGPVGAIPRGDSHSVPAFPLFDPRKRVGMVEKRVPGHGPGIRNFDDEQHFPPQKTAPMPDDPVSAERLCQRLLATQAALDDLPRQARRLVKMMASGKAKFLRPMRPGRPPGHRERGRHPVDAVLAECHHLALMALAEPSVRTPP